MIIPSLTVLMIIIQILILHCKHRKKLLLLLHRSVLQFSRRWTVNMMSSFSKERKKERNKKIDKIWRESASFQLLLSFFFSFSCSWMNHDSLFSSLNVPCDNVRWMRHQSINIYFQFQQACKILWYRIYCVRQEFHKNSPVVQQFRWCKSARNTNQTNTRT